VRAWFGTVGLAAVGIAVSIVGPVAKWPVWLWVILALAFALGAVLLLPLRTSEPSSPQSAFIKGDADGSTFRRVDAQADVFVGGNARRTRLYDVVFRTPDRRGR